MATIRAVPELCVCINTKLLSNKNNKSEICGGLVRNSSCVGVLNVYGKRRCSRRWRVKAVARSDVNGNVRVIEKSSGGNVKGNRSGLVDITVLCYQNRCNARRISINLSKWKYPQECSFATCPFGKSSSVTSSVFTSRVSLIYSHRGACFESTTISNILKGKGKSKDGSWLWCTTDDSVYDAVKSMTQHNVGALVVVKPGEQNAVAGIITERDGFLF